MHISISPVIALRFALVYIPVAFGWAVHAVFLRELQIVVT